MHYSTAFEVTTEDRFLLQNKGFNANRLTGGNETARIFGSVTVRGEAISVRGDKSNKAP